RRSATTLSVSHPSRANILDVRAGVEEALASLAKTLPAGLKLSKTYDLAEFVATAIANVRDAILIGSVLAVIVLLVFLRDWRLTLVGSVPLPLTVMTTVLIMRWVVETMSARVAGRPPSRDRPRDRRRGGRGRKHLPASRRRPGAGGGGASRDARDHGARD